MEKAYNYSDIYLVPKYSELKSRNEADTSVEFLGRKFKAPWCPANMSSVIGGKTAHWLSENDYFYIYHRFENNVGFILRTRCDNWKLISISVGVKQCDKEFVTEIKNSKSRVDFITIDIAHGHSILMKEMIQHIKYNLPNVKIIAGNVCTPEAVQDLESWGADAAKIGIAGGQSCSTKNMTGFHVPMFSCISKCVAFGGPNGVEANIPIIADGGIRENGDIAKALAAGANLVMAGSLFAACTDAPGENVHKESTHYRFETGPKTYPGRITHKKYFGSASAKQKGENKHVEGFEVEIPCNGLAYEEKYKELTESLQSAISYAGGKDLKAFNTVEFITTK